MLHHNHHHHHKHHGVFPSLRAIHHCCIRHGCFGFQKSVIQHYRCASLRRAPPLLFPSRQVVQHFSPSHTVVQHFSATQQVEQHFSPSRQVVQHFSATRQVETRWGKHITSIIVIIIIISIIVIIPNHFQSFRIMSNHF